MATATAPARDEWINAADSARLLGTNARAVARLAAAGRIGYRSLPVKARYRRADVERLAREAVRAATAQ